MDTQPILSSVPETSGAAGPLPERKVTHTFPAPSPADTETLPCPDAAPAETPEGALPGETPEVPGKRCFRLPPWVRERVTAARAAFHRALSPWTLNTTSRFPNRTTAITPFQTAPPGSR